MEFVSVQVMLRAVDDAFRLHDGAPVRPRALVEVRLQAVDVVLSVLAVAQAFQVVDVEPQLVEVAFDAGELVADLGRELVEPGSRTSAVSELGDLVRVEVFEHALEVVDLWHEEGRQRSRCADGGGGRRWRRRRVGSRERRRSGRGGQRSCRSGVAIEYCTTSGSSSSSSSGRRCVRGRRPWRE